jgi:hypothetical protein
MSEEENMNDDTELSTETSTRKTSNPFLERLEENQRAQAKAALIKTICENVDQTVGAVYDALDADDSGDYIMLDLFKRMTIRELVFATAPSVDLRKTHAAALDDEDSQDLLEALIDDDDDEDDDDEDELIDDDDDEDDDDEDELIDDDDDEDDDEEIVEDEEEEEEEEEEPAPPVKKPKKKTKGKKGKKGSKGKKGKSAKGASTEGPTTLGAYKKRMLKHLRKASEPLSAQALKELIGGDKDLFTQAKDALLEEGEIESEGKARGTKYSIA